MSASGDGWSVATLDEMGEGPGFRKVRTELGVEAFGVNAEFGKLTLWRNAADETPRALGRRSVESIRCGKNQFHSNANQSRREIVVLNHKTTASRPRRLR